MSGTALVVDGDELAALATAQMLARHGWRPLVAVDAADALRALHTAAIDAVICDLGLPGDGALGVIRCAVAHPARPRVVAVAGDAADASPLAAQRAGAHAVLARPLDGLDLLSALCRD